MDRRRSSAKRAWAASPLRLASVRCLTTRCSGLAALAAELGIVRRFWFLAQSRGVALLRLPGAVLVQAVWAVRGRIQTARRNGGFAPAEVHRPGRQFTALESPADGPRRTIGGLGCWVVRACRAASDLVWLRVVPQRVTIPPRIGLGALAQLDVRAQVASCRRFRRSRTPAGPHFLLRRSPRTLFGGLLEVLVRNLGGHRRNRLTTRCSGLAALAAELGIVRRRKEPCR